jgi:hypothetical protein
MRTIVETSKGNLIEYTVKNNGKTWVIAQQKNQPNRMTKEQALEFSKRFI